MGTGLMVDLNLGTIYLRCEDRAEMLVIDKYNYDDGDFDWNFSIQDSCIAGSNSLKDRIKRAFQVLLGKPIYYADVYIRGNDKVIEFRDKLTELIEKGNV